MSYRIDKANKLQQEIYNLEHELKLNDIAIQAVSNARSGKHIIEELETKDKKLRKKLEKATKKFYSYADENLKISDLQKLNGYSEEEYQEPFDYED